MLYSVCTRNLFLNRKEWDKILGRQKVDDRIIEMLVSDFEITASVSYTHLDVYKRQAFVRGLFGYFSKCWASYKLTL